MGDYKALCSIPIIEPAPAENKTATELARAEEAREESRAVESGWDLIADLEDTCLYYVSGWWSYSFCRNTEIVQYHALASSPKGQPPKRDLHSPEYVLGRVPAMPSSSARGADRTHHDYEIDPIPAELQEKGNQRFLVQKLQGGTICDLTERERTIEVQYHCVPGLQTDKISWIKEVTICAYVMVVDTPRLCNDAAFLPPEPTKANAISCRLVSNEQALLLDQTKAQQDHEAEVPNTEEEAELDEAEAAAAAAATALKELRRDADENGQGKLAVVGDITVGSRSLLSAGDEAGRNPFKLTPPRSFMSTGQPLEPRVQIIVAKGKSREEGGTVEALTREELKKMDIDPDTVEDMAAQIQKLADGAGWRLEVSDSGLAGLRELKGYIDEDEDLNDEPDEKKAQKTPKKTPKTKAKKTKKAAQADGDRADEKGETQKQPRDDTKHEEETRAKPAENREPAAPEAAGQDAADEEQVEAEVGSKERFKKNEL